MITVPVPRSMIDSGYHGTCFFGFQVSGRPSQCFLVTNRKNAPILTRSRYILPQQMLNKTANGRQAAISRCSRVPTLRFDMIQKTEHAVGLDIFEGQVGHGLAFLIGQKQVEELQRVAVSTYRMRASSTRVL